MATVPFNTSREIFQFVSHYVEYVALIKPRFHRSSGAFFIYEKFPSLLYLLVFFPDISRSCDRKFVFASEYRQGVVVVNVIVERKRELSQKRNPCMWGAWKFSPKTLRTEKIPRQIIFISIKAFKRYVARFLKRCP